MNKDFVPYKESIELKELGFNEECFGYFENQDMNLVINFNNLPLTEEQSKRPGLHIIDNRNSVLPQWATAAPTFSQAFRWLREKYDWQHSIEPTADQHRFEVGYNYWIWNSKTGEEYHTMPKNRPTGDWEYETPEEAELECLRKLIEIVKSQK